MTHQRQTVLTLSYISSVITNLKHLHHFKEKEEKKKNFFG